MKVNCIRLDTGEVLIGWVKKLWNGDYRIEDAHICISEVKDGNMETNMARFPFAKEYTFTIKKGLIQTVFEAKNNSKLILRLRQEITRLEDK